MMKRVIFENGAAAPADSGLLLASKVRRMNKWSLLILAVLLGASTMSVGASEDEPVASPQQPTTAAADPDEPVELDAETKQRYEAFEQMLTGSRLIGRFSVIGKGDGAADQEEEYTIRRVSKASEGDIWVFMARIKYGDNDYTVPLPLEVKWAGDTPVVTLTDLTILGQGPFSARVVFHDGKYAGTWSHGEVGGHLIGRIVKDEPADPPAP